MRPNPLTLALGLGVLTAAAAPADATVILFERQGSAFGNVEAIPQGHGDRVTATLQDGFVYGDAFGFTPNVVVDWHTGSGSVGGTAAHYPTGFGDLLNVIEAEPEPNGTQFTLTADAGYEVLLHGFDMAGWPTADYTIDAVRVRDGSDDILFEQLNAAIDGAGPSHTSFDFAQPLAAPVLKIEWDSSNLGGSSDNIGMDNVAFGQTRVPEPATALLLLAAGLATFRRLRPR